MTCHYIPRPLFVLFCFIGFTLHSQPVSFQKEYGRPGQDAANDVIELADGYLLAGQTTDPATNRLDAFLLRTDKSGTVLWQKTYGAAEDDIFRNVAVANDGGFIAWGSTRLGFQGNTESWLVKTDDAGNLVWQKTVGTPQYFEAPSGRIIPVPGGYVLSGARTTTGYSQSFVLRVDNDGNTVWSRFTPSAQYNSLSVNYVIDSLVYLNGVVNDQGCWRTMNVHTGAIVQSREYHADTTQRLFQQYPTPDGGHLMSGFVLGSVPGLNRTYGWVQKVDAAGQLQWSKTFKVAHLNFIYTHTLLPDGSCVFAMNYYPVVNSGATNSMLVKLDAGGNVLWVQNFGSARSVWLEKIIPTGDGGLLAAGHVESGAQGFNAFLLKTDASGAVAGCCPAGQTLIGENAPIEYRQETVGNDTFPFLQPTTLPQSAGLGLEAHPFCSNVQPSVTRTVKLEPGETLTLNGSSYSAPDTLSLTLPSTNGGCDTLATYFLALDCDSTFVKRFTALGKNSSGYKIVPGPNQTFYTATAVGDNTLLALVDKNLDPIWSQAYDLAGGPEFLLDLRLDAQGQLIGVGNTATAPVNCFAFKLDVNTRQVLWLSSLNSPVNSYFTRILEKNSDGSGHYFLLGQTDAATGGSGCDALLLEIDRDNGTLVWDRHYTLGSCEIFNDVFIENNLVYVCGRYNLDGGGQAGFRPALSRLDLDGNVEWSRHYLRLKGVSARLYASQMLAEPDGVVLVGYGAKSGTDLTNNATVQLLKTDRDGQLLWAKDYDLEGTQEQTGFKIAQLPDGYLLGGIFLRSASTAGREIFLIKTDKNGAIQWQRAYGFDGEDRLRDLLVHGGYIYLVGSTQNNSGSDMFAAKLNPDGTVDPAVPCPFVKPLGAQVQDFNPLFGVQHNLMPLNVAHNYAVAPAPAAASETLVADVACAKDCGQADPCADNPNPGVQFPDHELCAGTSEVLDVPGFAAYAWSPAASIDCATCATVTLSPATTTQYTLVLTDSAGCTAADTFLVQVLPLNARTEIIAFCPGETVVIGGTAYTQPGTVLDTLPALAFGCDTVVTYTLAYKTTNQPSTLQISCPANQAFSVPHGTGALPVAYPPAVATSDCPCPDMQLSRISGLASGAAFPPGISTVCYRAEDACGTSKTCCFTVQIDEENACDVKTNGCVRFELVSINRDTGQNWVYRVRMTNHCSAELAYAYIQLPDGVQALAPAQNAVYAGVSGHAYTVRNPNFSPFYSLRFTSNGGGIANGQSDVFRYVLPEQTDINYIHAAVRLNSGAYIETHLNTFNCPVGAEPPTLPKPEARAAPVAPVAVQVVPNPVAAGARLSLSGGALAEGVFRLQDVAGKTVWECPVQDQGTGPVPAYLAPGLYFYTVFENGQRMGSGKLLVE